MPYFDSISPQPPLHKYELVDQFLADNRAEKIFAATGAFKNAQGQTPLLQCVRIAEAQLHDKGLPRDYLDPAGYRPLSLAMTRLLLSDTHRVAVDQRIRTAHTPGGTAALRVGADLLGTTKPGCRIWVCNPTWGNHLKVFRAAGLDVQSYAYSVNDAALDFERLMVDVRQIPRGDVLFLQASTHNPTCVDLSTAQWSRLAKTIAEHELLPFFDVAFFGFTAGLDEDLAGLRTVLATDCDAIIATSLSKSFSLYNRRVGTLSVVGASREGAENAFSHVMHLIRANYSNPPIDGAAIVAEILNDPQLFATWQRELEQMRQRMASCRNALADTLERTGVDLDLSYITREKGIFTQLPLSREKIDALRSEHSIYIPADGRLNLTAIPDAKFGRFCTVISQYL